MKIFRIVLLFIITSLNLSAALPPLYQSLKEYQELLNSPQLLDKLDSADLIDDIQRYGNRFMIRTSKHNLQVDLVYELQSMPGPQNFHFIFHEAEGRDLNGNH